VVSRAFAHGLSPTDAAPAIAAARAALAHEESKPMSKGQKKQAKTNKPKLSTKEKQAKKKAKAAAK
jgi:hypothetical protein